MKSIELLSPAGNFAGLIGAIKAGADAVYLGGERFSARAYAGNFDNESLIRALNLAHLFERRVYLTVNTLIKEKEFSELYDFLCPLYENGVDAVIVQDLGILRWIKNNFPGLKIHASTQMSITSIYGAEFLKENGISRIVPARELLLSELKEIKEKTDVGLETFIHGAMCYSYSGKCLFSSALGERSGNRGRCAQPCRLPYQKNVSPGGGGDWYPLSMKDMCTIDLLGELIESGIDAFKIEGRMKKPEYTAFVTSVYRKHIDSYYQKVEAVSDCGLRELKSLYLRGGISQGYYKEKKSAAMITHDKPTYDAADLELLKKIRAEYLEQKMTIPVNGRAILQKDKNAELAISYKDITVNTKGSIVQEAKNQPLLTESVNKQLMKTGDTNFIFHHLNIKMTDDIFIPVKALNELRRTALANLEEEILRKHKRKAPKEHNNLRKEKSPTNEKPRLHALITTLAQWEIASIGAINRLYINIDLWHEHINGMTKSTEQKWYALLPPLFNSLDAKTFEKYEIIINQAICTGVLVSNIDGYGWLKKITYPKPIVLDSSLYLWNHEARQFFYDDKRSEFYLPQELTLHELRDILDEPNEAGLLIYGRTPLMYSANCVNLSRGNCRKDRQESGFVTLCDRYNKHFFVYHDCRQCYNIIYNSVPLSLHDVIKSGKLSEISKYRLDFTNETEAEMKLIINYFDGLISGNETCLPYQDYTTGHIKRKVL
ncbi:MAG: U32 family peptidase [Lachnospiraceae bacterium]|nr:U32 family peptidase [Lachnospiraceae bacterium]